MIIAVNDVNIDHKNIHMYNVCIIVLEHKRRSIIFWLTMALYVFYFVIVEFMIAFMQYNAVSVIAGLRADNQQSISNAA